MADAETCKAEMTLQGLKLCTVIHLWKTRNFRWDRIFKKFTQQCDSRAKMFVQSYAWNSLFVTVFFYINFL